MLTVLYSIDGIFSGFRSRGFEFFFGFHPNPPESPHSLYTCTPMQPCHMMDYNESGAWRPGVGRNGEVVQIVGWGLGIS